MQHRASSMAAGLLALAGLISLAAPRGTAADADKRTPEGATLEERLEEMRNDMEEMRRQLKETQRQLENTQLQLKNTQLQLEEKEWVGREHVGREPGITGAKEEELAEGELEQLRRLADEEARPEKEGLPTERSFIARGLGLQALNPEISLAGDFLMSYLAQEGARSETAFDFRVLDIHIESYLDPFSMMKAAIGVNSSGAKLGEAYFTRFGVLPGFNVTAGKFRQQFGVVNRWHKHALDQIDFPLALRQIFGDGGLNQTGLSLDWAPPELWGGSQGAMVQVTEGENDRVFGQNSRHLPSILARYHNYRDLSKDTYVDIGLTGLTGWNDEWQIQSSEGEGGQYDSRQTWVLGADVSLRWEPTERMRYASLEWRTEFYYLDKGILAPDGSGRDRINAWGAYTYLQRQISRTVEIGARLDYFEPDSKSYAGIGEIAPLAVVGSSPNRWQVGPYITWWQSPFVKLRFEADYSDGHRTGPREFTGTAQAVFAAGPHKHERY